MKDYSSYKYNYAGNNYLFATILFTDAFDGRKENVLANENVYMFQYESALNELYLTAELVYVDKFGVVDKYLDQQFVYCKIIHQQYDEKRDGTVTIDIPSETAKLEHDFLVTGIEITNRVGHEITYKLKMVSINWQNCVSNVNYSNYSQDSKDIFSIVKALLVQKELVPNKETFDNIKTSVKLDYITSSNDTVLTSVKYLLDKLYYYKDKDNSLKFLMYNEHTKQYQLFDLANSRMINGTYVAIISMFKTQTEGQTQIASTQLATVVKMPKLKSFMNLIDRKVSGYDYSTNSIQSFDFSTDSIVNYKNEKPSSVSDPYVGKYVPISSKFQYFESGTYWNNDFGMYNDAVKALSEDNSLVLNLDADLLRKPGSHMIVSVDRDDVSIAGTEDLEKLEETKSKYKSLEGLWTVSKVRHIVMPATSKYRQNVVLFRNFIQK